MIELDKTPRATARCNVFHCVTYGGKAYFGVLSPHFDDFSKRLWDDENGSRRVAGNIIFLAVHQMLLRTDHFDIILRTSSARGGERH